MHWKVLLKLLQYMNVTVPYMMRLAAYHSGALDSLPDDFM
jgi:hypothetical protein